MRPILGLSKNITPTAPMYWNVPKDHRKIQQVILAAVTATRWGVMLPSPVRHALS